MRKKDLAILLSGLETFVRPDVDLEQYQTDAEVASSVLWFIHMKNEFEGRIVADLGCGNGVLGIGALALGAKKVFFVDVDKKAIALVKNNLKLVEKKLSKKFDSVLVNKEVNLFSEKVGLVIQNPPFGIQRFNPPLGVQKSHADRLFLLKALQISNLVYSFHTLDSDKFVNAFSKDHGFSSDLVMKFKFPIRQSMAFHAKKIKLVEVGLWRIYSV